MDKTKNNTGLALQVAINYGSRLEITEAVRRISKEVAAGALTPEQISEELISSFLYTSSLPDPEMMIRTGGEMRLSNYLLWQAAYTELYITEVLWPSSPRKSLINQSKSLEHASADTAAIRRWLEPLVRTHSLCNHRS